MHIDRSILSLCMNPVTGKLCIVHRLARECSRSGEIIRCWSLSRVDEVILICSWFHLDALALPVFVYTIVTLRCPCHVSLPFGGQRLG